jgi:hypothetical protein
VEVAAIGLHGPSAGAQPRQDHGAEVEQRQGEEIGGGDRRERLRALGKEGIDQEEAEQARPAVAEEAADSAAAPAEMVG